MQTKIINPHISIKNEKPVMHYALFEYECRCTEYGNDNGNDNEGSNINTFLAHGRDGNTRKAKVAFYHEGHLSACDAQAGEEREGGKIFP